VVRRVSAILNTSLLLAAVCAAGAVPRPLSDDQAAKGSSPSNRANPAPEPPPPPQSAPAGHLSPVQSSDGSATAHLPPASAFNSSFDATHPAEAKPPDPDIPKSVDLTPTAGDDGQPDALPAASGDSLAGAIPGRAWVALIALGVMVAVAVRAAVARSSRQTATVRLPTWLAPRCPYCQNPIARASSRRSALESWVLPLLLIAPVRCLECRRRYYSLVFFARGSGVRNW
jgi:hypothetical protein